MYKFFRLDIMIAYSCNLSCAGCISLSDFKRNGVEPLTNLQTSLVNWKNKISPEVITIFGGEPCIHPDLIKVCQLVRDCWPNSLIRLITNGYLLNNFSPNEWFRFFPFEIQVSVHRKDHEQEINNNIKSILTQQKDWQTTLHQEERQHKQIEWSVPGFSIYKSIFGEFVTPYKLNQHKLEPWNSDPVVAHGLCGSPATPILYKDRLYKCPPVANVIDLTKENWFNYQSYGISDDLENFVKHINKPESVCGQCPEKNQGVINHMDINNVKLKKKFIG